MKLFEISLILFLLVSWVDFSNGQSISVTCTAINDTTWTQLDSIMVMNRTQGGDTTLYYPDTVLTLYYVGIDQHQAESKLQVQAVYPNPMTDQATIRICVPKQADIKMLVSDVVGRKQADISLNLQQGTHEFVFKPGGQQLYFLSVISGSGETVKMINSGKTSGNTCLLSYVNTNTGGDTYKSTSALTGFNFEIGDELLYIGYLDTLESGIPSTPEFSETFTFQFATNIPCPGIPTVTYEGQTYNTVQIFSQCWLKVEGEP